MCVCGERNLVQTYLGVLIDYFLKSTTILHIEQLLFFFLVWIILIVGEEGFEL